MNTSGTKTARYLITSLAIALAMLLAAAPAYARQFEEQWMGIYEKSAKVGFTHHVLKREIYGYSLEETAELRLAMMGAKKKMRIDCSARLDDKMRAIDFKVTVTADVPMRITGNVADGKVALTVDSGGVSRTQQLVLNESPLISTSVLPLEGMLEPGARFRFPLLDPATAAQGTLELVVVGPEGIRVMGESVDAMRLEGSTLGSKTVLWATKDGEIVKEESMGLTFIKEPRSQAVSDTGATADLITDLSIPFNLRLDPGVSYLKLRLRGIELSRYDLQGGGQTLHGDILEIARMEIPAGGDSNPPAQRTGSDPLFVEDNDPAIRSRAAEITAGASDRTERARLIYEWVYRNVRKAPTVSIPRASDVLRTMQGDCNEHTVLYTALARSAGVPTRMALGLVYQGGRFYYHAWPEVYIDGWVPVDPTLGQFPADASHIRLINGGLDRQAMIAPAMGSLTLEGIESR